MRELRKQRDSNAFVDDCLERGRREYCGPNATGDQGTPHANDFQASGVPASSNLNDTKLQYHSRAMRTIA